MADIDVVKKGSRTWIWIVMLLVLALIVWFLMAGTGPDVSGSLELQEGAVGVTAGHISPEVRRYA